MNKLSKRFASVFTYIFLVIAAFAYRLNCFAQDTLTPQMLSHQKPPYENFDDVTIHYSVFNSTQMQADIAKIHDLKRSSNTVLINIAVVDNQAPHSGGIPAILKGKAANLMQQQRTLDFKEINENGIVYYLASLRFNNEEIIHFTIEVEPLIAGDSLNKNEKAATAKTRTVKFTKTLYTND